MKKIAFLVERFELGTPGQQLLDRFLCGYPWEGEFRAPGFEVTAWAGASNEELQRRARDFGLRLADSPAAAVAESAGAVIVAESAGARRRFLAEALKAEASSCFVHGVLGEDLEEAQQLVAKGAGKKRVLAGTPLPVTWRLPEITVRIGEKLGVGMAIVQGESGAAELLGLEALQPLAERRSGGESGVKTVRRMTGAEVWAAGKEQVWPERLLMAALSRSDTPQGDPVKDGRTQDLWKLGLVPKLCRAPRGWVLEHKDGFTSVILVLNGVVSDINVALEKADGDVLSAQLYRPPAPGDQQFDCLARSLEGFFDGGSAPWPVERNVLEAGVLAVMREIEGEARGRQNSSVDVRYSLGAR